MTEKDASQNPKRPEYPTVFLINPDQYEIVTEDRRVTDSMMWQSPALSLTAQAFLMTIALQSDISVASRFISSILGLATALASMQLFVKHRAGEKRLSMLLEEYEKKHSSPIIHSKPKYKCWFVNLSSYVIWVILLILFGVASLAILLMTCFCPDIFESTV